FRKAIRAAWDRTSYLMVSAPEDLAKAMLRNINNFPDVVRTSDGTSYGDLVTAAYDARTGTDIDLSDGQNPFYSKDEALAYLDAAREDGLDISADNPIHLDMLVPETSKRLVDQAQSLKDSIESNTDGQIIIELVMRDMDTVRNIAYYSMSPAEADYDISTFTGWSPDYADPKSFVDIYSPVSGYYMKSMGLTDSSMTADAVSEGEPVYGSDDDIKEQVGLMEYEELYRAADAIYDDLDARYKAFAEADAELVDKCFFIPSQMQSRTVRVTHVVPFSRVYSTTGLTEYKYKGLKLEEGLVTSDEYNAAYEDFQTGGTPAQLTSSN
ncbi:MAG: peptide ABC transporter substrate-binding protein, partial [Bulleidia sp.]